MSGDGISYELARVRLRDTRETTLYLLRYPRAIGGEPVQHETIAGPWGARPACVHSDGEDREDLPRVLDSPHRSPWPVVTALLFEPRL